MKAKILGLLAVGLLAGPMAANATLIGQTLTHGCAQCGPPYSQSFIVTQDAGPELTPFDQWQLDVEASTARVTWLVTASQIASPLNFTLSGVLGGINSVTLDASSTFNPTGLTFDSSSFNIDLSGSLSVARGAFMLFNVNQTAVPEPGTLALLGLGLLGLGVSRRKA